MATERFPILIGRKSRIFLRVLFGVTPERAWATLGEGKMTARFGWWQISVPTDAIVSWRIEGPWRWITAIGVRRSLRSRDLSFAGSPRGGVRMDFVSPVRWMNLTVPAFYVGVEDLDGFGAALAALGIPEQRA